LQGSRSRSAANPDRIAGQQIAIGRESRFSGKSNAIRCSGSGRCRRLRSRGPVSPFFTGIPLGSGIVGFIDEAVFHQLLQ
jgi:hypothetical protein